MILREYQNNCVEAIWRNLDKHSVASCPTGSGKTPIIAELIRRFLEYPGTHILLLTHKRELIRQNVATLEKHLPFGMDIGVYCAGLHQKELRQVTVASVQSIIRADNLPPFEIIIVDECHLIPHKDTGQYHDLFAFLPDARIIGLTATPYRMDGGLLHLGKERLFDALVYEAKTGDLIRQGWLSPIRARLTTDHADLSSVHIRMGDFKNDEMTAVMDHEAITNAAVKDVLTHASDRHSILVFCAGVEHAHHVQAAFRQVGQNSIATVTEETSMRERDEATEKFKNKQLRILVNVGVYTTGFDAPNVDCIVLLRATKSAGLYVQIVGRGLRKCEDKEDCLLLDYGEHVARFGPLDMITSKTGSKGEGQTPIKTCPECGTMQFAGRKTCEHCGFLFPKNEAEAPKHGTQASALDPIAATQIRVLEVRDVEYIRHQGHNGKPDSMVVNYYVSIAERVQEWVCPLHSGYPMQKCQAWFARRGVTPMPRTVEAAIDAAKKAMWPAKISVRREGKYDTIVSYGEWRAAVPEEPKQEVAK